MLKNKTHLEVEIEGQSYTLTCDPNSPLGNLHDALMQMKAWAVDRMVANHKEEERMVQEQTKIEGSVNEEAE